MASHLGTKDYLTSSGNRCGHSICIEDDKVEEVQRWVNDADDGGAVCVIKEFGDTVHKPEFRGHSKGFWMDVQSFHDVNEHWLECELGNELSNKGKDKLAVLKEFYK